MFVLHAGHRSHHGAFFVSSIGGKSATGKKKKVPLKEKRKNTLMFRGVRKGSEMGSKRSGSEPLSLGMRSPAPVHRATCNDPLDEQWVLLGRTSLKIDEWCEVCVLRGKLLAVVRGETALGSVALRRRTARAKPPISTTVRTSREGITTPLCLCLLSPPRDVCLLSSEAAVR